MPHKDALVSRQGFGEPKVYGPKTPTAVMALLAATAELGPISRASTLLGRPQLGKA